MLDPQGEDIKKLPISRQSSISEKSTIAAVPVISSYVLQGLPAFIRDQIGEIALDRANLAAGFDVELIESRNCFISQRSVLEFVEVVARAAGEPGFGLVIAPFMNVGGFGTFGGYVFGARTLGQALKRGADALRYHSNYDKLSISATGNEVRYTYRFALAGSRGYGVVASATAGLLLSVFRAYLPDSWHPLRVELDIPAPRQASIYEDIFQCPVIFGAPAVTIIVDRHRMTTPPKHSPQPLLTIEDIARDRAGGAPRGFLEVTIEQIRAQVFAGSASIDNTARSMDTSIRTFQRELHRAGTDFRKLTSMVRIQRATELLRESDVSIISISEDLGYSTPGGFTRAFQKATGYGPREFRLRELMARSS